MKKNTNKINTNKKNTNKINTNKINDEKIIDISCSDPEFHRGGGGGEGREINGLPEQGADKLENRRMFAERESVENSPECNEGEWVFAGASLRQTP
jgi:hypothetical protein